MIVTVRGKKKVNFRSENFREKIWLVLMRILRVDHTSWTINIYINENKDIKRS